ncbi:MAG: hypothetical protein R3E50_15805 [Halioglobus sp.]
MEFTNIFVYDPTREVQPAFDRAVAIAAALQVKLHLFAAIFSGNSQDREQGDADQVVTGAAKRSWRTSSRRCAPRALRPPPKSSGTRTGITPWCGPVRNNLDVVLKSRSSSTPPTRGC